MPEYQIQMMFRVDTDDQAREIGNFMEKVLCDYMKDRPAACIRVEVNEIGPERKVIREVAH